MQIYIERADQKNTAKITSVSANRSSFFKGKSQLPLRTLSQVPALAQAPKSGCGRAGRMEGWNFTQREREALASGCSAEWLCAEWLCCEWLLCGVAAVWSGSVRSGSVLSRCSESLLRVAAVSGCARGTAGSGCGVRCVYHKLFLICLCWPAVRHTKLKAETDLCQY